MAFAIHSWLKITHIEANVQHHHNFWHQVICDNGDSMQSICQTRTFRQWICKCRVLLLHQIWQQLHLSQHTHGGKTLTQPVITGSKIQHANSFCVTFHPQQNSFCRLTKLFFLYSSFDRFKSSTCHNVCEFFICLFYTKSFHIDEDDS